MTLSRCCATSLHPVTPIAWLSTSVRDRDGDAFSLANFIDHSVREMRQEAATYLARSAIAYSGKALWMPLDRLQRLDCFVEETLA